MALVGKFITDFSDFYTAVQQADLKLKTLGDGAASVGTKLNRMVDQFSGRQLIQQATLMSEAVERIGGVGKLTETELARVGAQATETLAKMKALGMEAPANLQKIAAAAKPVSGGFADMLKGIAPLASAFGVAFSAQAVIGFAKSVFDAAGSLVELSDKTGISIEALQLLQVAGDDAGNTIDEMTSAVTQMQNRLAEGDDSALAALQALGIEYENFRRLTPDRQFILISDALRQIKDPAEQVRLAMDLFGRQGAQILPTLKRGFDDLKDSVHGMSEQSARDLDAAADAWGRWWRNVKGVSANAITWLARLPNEIGIAPAERRAAEATKELADSMGVASAEAQRLAKQDLFTGGLVVSAPTGNSLQDLEYSLDQAARKNLDLAKASEESTKAQEKHNAELREYNNWLVMREFDQAAEQAKRLAEATAAAAKNQAFFNQWVFASSTPLESQNALLLQLERNMANVGKMAQTTAEWEVQGIVAGVDTTALETFEQTGGKALAGFGKFLQSQVPATIIRAIEGGGDISKAIGSSIGGFFTEKGSALQKAVSGIGGMVGGALGAVVPVIGAFAGPALDLAVKGIGKLFGRDEESKVVNPLRDKFIEAAGGLHELNVKAHDAGLTLDNLLRADKEAEFKTAVDELTAAFQFQNDSLNVVLETAQRYGFTLEELGPAMQRQELDKQAQQLYKDFEVLNAAGIDTVAITEKMAASVNAYVQQALAMGVEVPEAMRPMLQRMVDMGQLTDASGNKIESLEDSGISFAMTMSQGFKSLIDSVSKLTDAISRGLGLAVDTTSNKIKNMPRQVGVDVVYHDPGFKDTQDVFVTYHGGGGGEGLESYQEGTEGYRNFGAGTPVMLHGMEAVVPFEGRSTAGPPLLGGAGGGGEIVVHTHLMLDGREIASSLERIQNADYQTRNRMRAA